jgi:hypothetical protein
VFKLSSGIRLEKLRFDVIHKKVGHDFPGETFRVMKDKEERELGEYRTRRLVLEAWDRISGGR